VDLASVVAVAEEALAVAEVVIEVASEVEAASAVVVEASVEEAATEVAVEDSEVAVEVLVITKQELPTKVALFPSKERVKDYEKIDVCSYTSHN